MESMVGESPHAAHMGRFGTLKRWNVHDRASYLRSKRPDCSWNKQTPPPAHIGAHNAAERGEGGVQLNCSNRKSAVSHDERSREDLAKARDDL